MKIVIPGDPIPKARAKFSTRGKFMRAYDPQEKLKKFCKKQLEVLASQANNDFKSYFSHPLSLSLSYHMPINKSDTEATKNLKLWGLITPCVKPDVDNLIKWSSDIANGILWHDDAQIVDLISSERYSENPCTIIEVNPIAEIEMNAEYEKVFKIFSPEDVKNFLKSVKHLWIGIPNIGENPECVLHRIELAQIAKIMISFSNEWADKLKKIKGK
jgi:Holliday junction resolvase RusA-like endonuclease